MSEYNPWNDVPNKNATTLNDLFKEVAAGSTAYSDPAKWEELGYEIPVIEGNRWHVMAKSGELMEQGKPCYMMIDGVKKFSIISQADQLEEQKAELADRQEFLAEQEYWVKNPNRLKTVADMCKTPEIDWIVQDKIHRSGLFQIYGASYSGKTLLVLDLVMSWCAGLPEWQGYQLNNDGQPQEALYVAAEGGAALSVHVDAWLKYHSDVDPSRLSGLVFLDGGEGHNMFLEVPGKRRDEPSVSAEDSWIRLLKEVLDKGLSPSIVVFDTQIDLAPGIDENSNTDMVGVLREVKRLGDKSGFMAVVVHHTGHDGNKARGASGMMGKADVQAKLSAIGEKTGKARLEWIKVKGRACPQDTISYHIQGWQEIEDFDSEGAVCVPMSKLQEATAKHTATSLAPTAKHAPEILKALASGKKSKRELSVVTGLYRDSDELKNVLEMMEFNLEIKKTGQGRNTGYELADFALAPAEVEVD